MGNIWETYHDFAYAIFLQFLLCSSEDSGLQTQTWTHKDGCSCFK